MWGKDLALCETRIPDKESDCPSCLNTECFFNNIFVKEGDYLKKEVDKAK